MEYFQTNLHPTDVQKLGSPKLRLPDGRIVEGSFEVVGENNQGQAIVIEYTIPGQIRLQPGPGNSLHRPQRPITKAEFEQWQKDHSFVFAL